ncbi:MAG TPA: hypothetical protein DC057_01135 [Spirochaetia bacterium]|nr:hypothetical protein [Spirochaetia bacterium]
MSDNRISITNDQLSSSNKITRYINKAVYSWENYINQTLPNDEESEKWYKKAEKIAQAEAKKRGYFVSFDYPGLYPTFEIVGPDGKEYTAYTTADFFRRINGFYD